MIFKVIDKPFNTDKVFKTENEKYEYLVNLLGAENIRKLVLLSNIEIKNAYRKNETLNTIENSVWLSYAGIKAPFGHIESNTGAITDTLKNKGMVIFNIGEIITLLKYACLKYVGIL